MEVSDMMEKLIVTASEFHQDFLEKVLGQLDKSYFKPRLQRLFGEHFSSRSESAAVKIEGSVEEERKSSTFSKKSKFGRKRDTKNSVKPMFVISKRTIRLMARFKAYHAIASLVSRDYFFCG